MSSVRQEGKDQIIFVTKDDHVTPSGAELVEEDPNDPYEERGLILASGEINWNCPCLGGMASGPCGAEFKDAFSCFHYSNEEVKGSDCLEPFRAMQECMQRFPELYLQEDEKVEKDREPGPGPSSQPPGPGPSSQPPGPGPSSQPPETLGTNSASASEQHSNASQPHTESSEGR